MTILSLPRLCGPLAVLLGVLAADVSGQRPAAMGARRASPAEAHEYYGTLTFEDGQQLTGGPAIKPRQMIYMDALGTREIVLLQLNGEDLMGSRGPGLKVKWSRDARGRLVAAEFRYGDGRKRPARFRGIRSEPIEVVNGGDHIRGRLHLPMGKGPHPAMVLISGSGDGTRRFGTFVSFFVDLGMAVIAYDKRGSGSSEGDWRTASYDVLAEDVACFVDALGDRPDIDRKRIGLMGHSEGGFVAPITAAKRKSVAFVLVRVGPAIPSPDVTRYGFHHIGVRMGKSGVELEAWDRLATIFTGALRDGAAFDSMQKRLEPLRKEGWMAKWSPGGGMLNAYKRQWTFRLRNANHDPDRYLSTLRAPVLWFLGEKDINVETSTTVAALDKSLADHPDSTVVVLPGIDHTFVVRRKGGSNKYAPNFWGRIRTWLKDRAMTGGTIR